MKLTYETTFDHWVAVQVFDYEKRRSLKKLDTKEFLRLLAVFIVIDLFILWGSGLDAGFYIFTLIFAGWILYYLLCRHVLLRNLIYQRMKIGYCQEFEQENDKTVCWEITPEQLFIRKSDCEFRCNLECIRKITVCPKFLFVELGFDSTTGIPRQAVSQTDYDAFYKELIDKYQACAQRHQQEVNIVHSDWTIDVSAIGYKEKTSLKRIFLTLLWCAIFFIAGLFIFGILGVSATVIHSYLEFSPFENEEVSYIAAIGFMIGSTVFGFAGLILGLLGKLPGTRRKSHA